MLCLHLEIDDPYEVRKELPNVCICGGIPISLLGSGTKEQVIDCAKRLINDLGQDGGFILSTDTILSFRNDAKRERIWWLCMSSSESTGADPRPSFQHI